MSYTIDALRPILSRVRTDITAIKAPDGASIWKRDQPLTDERIQAHLDGVQLRGVCPIKEGESTTMLALLDLDSHKGETSWDGMLDVAQLLYDTLQLHGIYLEGFSSSGGKGVHLIAIWDEPQDAYSVRKVLTEALAEIGYKNGTGGVAKKEVEIFPKQDHVPVGGCGNQFILPYSPKGKPIGETEWKPCKPVPFFNKPTPQPKARPVFHVDDPKGEAAEALSFVPNDDYWVWVEMAMALSDEFGAAGFSIWDSWSSGSPKYNGKEMWKKWQSFRNEGITIATLYNQARLHGWRPAPIIRPEVDTSIADAFVGRMEQRQEPEPVQPPVLKVKEIDPMKLDGLLGDTVRWICSDAMFPMPMLALLHVLSWAGAVFGRRYASPMNTRTNLYLVGVANTASGKNHSRVKLPILAREAKLTEFGGAHGVISDTGIARSLYERPSQMLMLDEWGMVLQSIGDKKAPSHNKKIKTLLMALYSQSGSNYSHGDYANKKVNESITIENPNLCVYGTTTEKEYVKALSKDAVESGELNRVMAIKVEPVLRRRTDFVATPPQDLIDRWERFSQGEYSLSTATNGSVAVEPKIVGWGECNDLQWKLALEQDDKMQSGEPSAALWGRRHENIIKIAMISAIARNMEVPEMCKQDFELAVWLVDKSIHYMTRLIDDRLPETDYESAIIEVQDFIRKTGKDGASRTDLTRRFRKFKARELDDIMTSLINQAIVIAERPAGSRGAATTYRYLGAA